MEYGLWIMPRSIAAKERGWKRNEEKDTDREEVEEDKESTNNIKYNKSIPRIEDWVILCYTIPYYTKLYSIILYYTILYYTILYYTILYFTLFYILNFIFTGNCIAKRNYRYFCCFTFGMTFYCASVLSVCVSVLVKSGINEYRLTGNFSDSDRLSKSFSMVC